MSSWSWSSWSWSSSSSSSSPPPPPPPPSAWRKTTHAAIAVAAASVLIAAVARSSSYLDSDSYHRHVVNPRRLLLRAGWKTGIFPLITLKTFSVPNSKANGGSSGSSKVVVPRGTMTDEHYRYIVEEWRPAPNDIVVSTFPKSGTHLGAQLVLQTTSNGTRDFDNLHHAAVMLEMLNIDPIGCGDANILTARSRRPVERAADPPDLRGVVLTHMPADIVLKDGDGDGESAASARYVVIVRDPLDSLLSLTSLFGRMMGPGGPTMDEAYRYLFVEVFGGWAKFNLGWWEEARRRPDRILLLFYEDILANLTDTVVQTAGFLGVGPFEPDVLERVRHRCSLDYMKPNMDKFEPPRGCRRPFPGTTKGSGPKMVNKGTVGRGRIAATAEIKAAMKSYVLKSLEGTDFPIGRYLSSFD